MHDNTQQLNKCCHEFIEPKLAPAFGNCALRYASIRKNQDHAKSLSKVIGCIKEDRICS